MNSEYAKLSTLQSVNNDWKFLEDLYINYTIKKKTFLEWFQAYGKF